MQWLHDHDQELNRLLVSKAAEYGAGDLDIMAAAMELLLPADTADRRSMAREMALAFYLLGKVGRMFSAYQRGVQPSLDSWRDAEAYAKMGIKVRETGVWV